jgi:hypothetical protein
MESGHKSQTGSFEVARVRIIWYVIPAFAWKDWVKPRHTPVRIADNTGYFSNKILYSVTTTSTCLGNENDSMKVYSEVPGLSR